MRCWPTGGREGEVVGGDVAVDQVQLGAVEIGELMGVLEPGKDVEWFTRFRGLCADYGEALQRAERASRPVTPRQPGSERRGHRRSPG